MIISFYILHAVYCHSDDVTRGNETLVLKYCQINLCYGST